MDWAKLLADTATYPDSLEFTINGQSVKLGDLRAHNTKTQGDTAAKLQQRESELATRESRTVAAQERLANIIEQVAKSTGLTFEQIVQGDTAAAQAAAARIRQQAGAEGIANVDGKIDWTKDPIYAPINERLSPIETTQGQLQQALRAGMTVIQADRAELAWLRFQVNNPELAKKLKYDDAVKKAVDAGYKDQWGFPDVSKAITELSQPHITDADKLNEYERGKREGAEAARKELMGGLPQPGGGGAAGFEFESAPDPNAGKKVVSIAEKLAQAMNDPDILRGATGTVQ